MGARLNIKDNHLDRIREVVNEIESLTNKKKELDHHVNALLSSLELLGVPKRVMKRVITNKKRPIEEIEEEEREFRYMLELLN